MPVSFNLLYRGIGLRLSYGIKTLGLSEAIKIVWVIQILGLEIDSKLGINEKFICIKHSKIILYKACKSYKHDLFRKTKKYRF